MRNTKDFPRCSSLLIIYRPALLQNKAPSCNKRAQDDVRHNPLFFHPDYTVGFGISPNQPKRLAGCTAGEELHLALKITFLLYGVLAVLSSKTALSETLSPEKPLNIFSKSLVTVASNSFPRH